MRLEVTYSVTAWTKAVEDEHRLLSQVLAILFSHVQLPADLLEGRLAAASQLRAIETEVGRPKEEKADFWTSIGGRYKASIDYAIKLEVESGLMLLARPRGADADGAHRTSPTAPGARWRSSSASAASCATANGEPVADAWVVLPDLGRFTSSNREGQFVFDGVRPGDHRVDARTRRGPGGERRGQGAGRRRRPRTGRGQEEARRKTGMTRRARDSARTGCPRSPIARCRWIGDRRSVDQR